MKKLPPNSEFEPPASRRRRTLSPHEHELWESVARQVKPLRKPRVVKAAPPAPAEPMMRSATLSSGKSLTPPRPPELPKRETPRGPPPLAPIGRRERAHLSRGTQADRRPHRSARHDPDPRAFRAAAFSAARQRRGHELRAGDHRQGPQRRPRIRARRAAPPGAALARPAGIPRLCRRLRGSRTSATAAKARCMCGCGGRR